jgi:hypothetical protein
MTIRETKPQDSQPQPREAGALRAPTERSQHHQLPDAALPLVEDYETVVGDRARFLRTWAHYLFPEFTLSWVAPEHREHAQHTKLHGLVFVSVLDDVAEKRQGWGPFDEAAAVVQALREHDVDDVFRHQWSEELAAARAFEGAFDVASSLDGTETVVEYHQMTRGLK